MYGRQIIVLVCICYTIWYLSKWKQQ